MALIKCPCCGEQISDRAQRCVRCGYILAGEPKQTCVDCGLELGRGATFCPRCGCPVEQSSSAGRVRDFRPEAFDEDDFDRPNGHLKLIVIILVVIAAILCIFLGLIGIKNARLAKESEDYGENIESVSYLMISGAAEAETCGNLIVNVWSNAIFEEKDSETDPYTRPDGHFVDDFNDALNNLFADPDFQDDLSDIESNQQEVAALLQSMKNPPEEWEGAYEDLQDYYDAYIGLTNMVLNPTGSLQTFSDDFNEADNEAATAYDHMQLYF